MSLDGQVQIYEISWALGTIIEWFCHILSEHPNQTPGALSEHGQGANKGCSRQTKVEC